MVRHHHLLERARLDLGHVQPCQLKFRDMSGFQEITSVTYQVAEIQGDVRLLGYHQSHLAGGCLV